MTSLTSFKLDRKAASKLLSSPDTYAFTLMTILLAAYKDEVFMEETAVLFTNIEEDFSCKLPEENENKINAALVAMTTDLFYTNPHVLTATALALSDGDIGDIPTGMMEEVEVPALLWAIYEVGLLNSDEDLDDVDDKFSPAVEKYIESIIAQEAIDLEEVEDEVDSVEEALDEPFYQMLINENLKALGAQLLEVGCNPRVVSALTNDNLLTGNDVVGSTEEVTI